MAVPAGLLVAVVGAVGSAGRLDRLHRRTDAAWVALDAALCRRARAVSALDSARNGDLTLRCAADAALSAGAAREEAENELGRALAVLDRVGLRPASAALLADAEQRVVIARRVYNDAVRDTLALRSHRLVRWLRLAGRAPLPSYFEIAEPGGAGAYRQKCRVNTAVPDVSPRRSTA